MGFIVVFTSGLYHRVWEDMAAVRLPTRLGAHHDWLGIASFWSGTLSLAADGSLWYWNLRTTPDWASDQLSLLSPSRRPFKMGSVFPDPK